ncbi:MAG: hypothetical protein RMK89_12510 [Armatimonadota bacterium]|nr:hypothetical protein [Armatimonadota bacterium]MDW8144271.1 hypothetical protein [Armatimonadota bacterium]
MGRIVIEVPDELQSRWEQLAKESGQSLEEFIVSELSKRCPPTVSPPTEVEDQREFVKAILRQAGLLEEFTEEEKRQYQPLSREERKRLAEKAGCGKPASEIILEERGER